MQYVRKAVFPVAGMGTRFLPATKASPKEMLPVVDKPLIQYAAEEAVAAGCDELIFITGRTKRAIADHFDKAYELESELALKNKTRMLEMVQGIIPAHVTTVYTRQNETLGLGHAVLCAKKLVGDEPFAVILADDMIQNLDGSSCLEQMVELYNERQSSVLGLEAVPPELTSRYGIVGGKRGEGGTTAVQEIVEKPKPSEAPSNLAVVGRYILTPRIFDLLETTERGSGGEIQLTDAIAKLLDYETVLGYEFDGKRFDCGDKLGYLKATVEYGLQHPELKNVFAEYLANLNV
ncbi:UTP-glucose-1-phosphate uridylyltransferase [gamma proteobacterium HTCC5015]|nr:UTP-glucose-1-phosphate uridylyltransferase [gamma proteobacterium HTCC5015]